MIPRRISRVPPRKVHEGACKAVSASTSSNRSSVAWRRPGRARGSRARRHCRDAGQKRQTLRLGAIAQQQGSALPVGDPMRPDRSAGSQQFLGHDVAFEHAALPAAVAPGPGHPDPATRPQPPAERRRPMTAEIAVWLLQPRSKLLGDKLASLGPRASDPGGGPTGSKRKAGYIVRCARGILKGYFIRGGLPTGRNIVLTTAT